MPTSILHAYRHAYRLAAGSAHTNQHADQILTSSRTGLRAPSSVVARRRARDAKRQMHRKDGVKERERSSDRLKAAIAAPSLKGTSNTIDAIQTQAQLASTVRRHFNSQQVSESEAISHFCYVVKHSSTTTKGGGSGAIGIRGSKSLGIFANEVDSGWEIGSNGREEDRRRDFSFRRRFVP